MADAKNRFSELVNRALSEGPPLVRRRKDGVVVMAQRDYEKLAGKRPTFKQWLLEGPALDALDLERDRSPIRDVQL